MADEPEITPDAGTGTDDATVETTEETSVTETPADDSADGDEDATEGDDTAQETKGDAHVPYARFKTVNERRKAAEAKAAELEAKLAALIPKEEKKQVSPKEKLKGLKPAPSDMPPLEQFEHYALETLEAHPEILDAWFERKFGMAPDLAASTLVHSTKTTQAAIRQQFESACSERGLDPRNPTLQHMVGTAMDSGRAKSFAEAMDVFAKPKQKTNGTTQKPTATKGAESNGVDVDGLSRVRVLPRTAREASLLAAQGKAIEHVSVSDILKAGSS